MLTIKKINANINISNLTNVKTNTDKEVKGMCRMYGYCRISRRTQNIERQVRNMLAFNSDIVIKKEAYTGTKIEGRKVFTQLLKDIKEGDTVVFDSVSRMSRNAEEGVKLYFELFNKGINLIFLKERYIDTAVYADNLIDKIELTGKDEDEIFKGINNYFRKLAERQIKIAFDQAQKEVDDLHERTKEGIETARLNGKQIGQRKGAKLTTKKSILMKEKIKKMSNTFEGNMTDKEVIETLGIARNTYYKYKREMVVGG